METMRARMATASGRSVSRLRIRSPTKQQTSDQGTPGTGCLPGKGAYASGSHSRLPSGGPTRVRGRNLTGDERHPGGRHLHHGRCLDGVEGSHRHGRRQQMNQDHAQRAVIQMEPALMRTLGNGLYRAMCGPMMGGSIRRFGRLPGCFVRHAVIHPRGLHGMRAGQAVSGFMGCQGARHRRREQGQPEDPQGKPDQPTMTKAATVHADDADGNGAGRGAPGQPAIPERCTAMPSHVTWPCVKPLDVA